jgi:hypothetical protein
MFNLATSAHYNLDFPRALVLYQDALDEQRSEVGENHVFVGQTLHMIGTVLKDMGYYMSARFISPSSSNAKEIRRRNVFRDYRVI